MPRENNGTGGEGIVGCWPEYVNFAKVIYSWEVSTF